MMGQDEATIVMSLANRYALAVDTQRWDMRESYGRDL